MRLQLSLPTTPTTPVEPRSPSLELFDGEQLVRDFEPLCDQLCVLFADDPATLRRLAKFREHYKDVASFAHLYDVAGVRVNGYWSYLRIWLRCFEAILDIQPIKPNALLGNCSCAIKQFNNLIIVFPNRLCRHFKKN